MDAVCVLVLLVGALSNAGEAVPGKTCGPPPLPKNGTVVGGVRSTYVLGGYVEYVCDHGFVHGEGLTAAVCIYSEQYGAHWNQPPPSCIRKRCSYLHACSELV